MAKRISTILFFGIVICTQAQDLTIDIQLKNHDEREVKTKEQLSKLLLAYDLRKWIYTKKVIIESGLHVVPHSHPVLTLSTRHLKDDELLLATFIHEQLHWHIDTHAAKGAIYEELKALFPHPTIEFPDGSGDEKSTLFHILICYLEYKALKQIVGELKAYQIISFWQQDHYRWIYRTIQDDQRRLEDLVRRYQISP